MKTFDDYFEVVKFASPETNVRFKEDSPNVPKNGEIIVKRCMNWEDVMHLVMGDQILTRNEIYCKWYIPYRPFARQDRVTALNHANESGALTRLLYDWLDSRVIFLDVHSDSYKIGKEIHQNAALEYYRPFGKDTQSSWTNDFLPAYHLIIPDKGAAEKIFLPHGKESTQCEKKRDPSTGKLSGFSVPKINTKLPLVLIDDICDGGGTFIGIAKELQSYRKKNTLSLYVTHGLFTKGIDCLLKYFDSVVTTNSVFSSDFKSDRFKVLDVLTDDFVNYGLLKHR